MRDEPKLTSKVKVPEGAIGRAVPLSDLPPKVVPPPPPPGVTFIPRSDEALLKPGETLGRGQKRVPSPRPGVQKINPSDLEPAGLLPGETVELICEPAQLSESLLGIQGEIARESSNLNELDGNFWLPPIGAMALFSIPWLWYFLLARIEELATAIRRS